MLHLASFMSNIPILQMLLHSNFPVYDTLDNGMNAFHIAAYYGNIEALQCFIKFAASKGLRQKKRMINTLNQKSQISALTYAIINKQDKAATILIQNGAMLYYYKSEL